MPIFEYRCSACDHLEEVLQKHSEAGPAVCPSCGKEGTLAKEMSATSFQLKGGGWYKDLYASTSKKDTSSASETAPKKDATSSTSATPAASSPAASSTSSASPAPSGASSSGASSSGTASGGSSAA